MNEFSGSSSSLNSSHQPPGDRCTLGDPQRRILRVLHDRSRQIRAGVEQIVLDLPKNGYEAFRRISEGERDPECGVRFVAVRVRAQSRVVLRYPRKVAQSGRSVVARAGVDPGEVDSHGRHGTGSGVIAESSLRCGVVSERFLVTGGNRLVGEVVVGGAKNSVLKLMAATLLAEGTSVITNCPPDILDVPPLMADVLRGLGCDVELEGDVVRITTPAQPHHHADFAAVRQFRASVCVLGPLVARCRRAVVALPGGGDAIGSRPLDMHQAGLRLLGAHSTIEHGCVVAEAEDLHGATIRLAFPSVGATENILMAAVLAKGETTIDNAAREPRSSICATCWCRWAHGSAEPARRRCASPVSPPRSCPPRTVASATASSQRHGGESPLP